MNLFTQDLLVLFLVAAGVGYVGWQLIQAVRGRRSKLGGCCPKGCAGALAEQNRTNARATPKTQFLPLDSLARKRNKS